MQRFIDHSGDDHVDDESLSGTITIDGTEIAYENVSLSQLIDQINEADSGYTASMINDGTENGWRLVLTGDTAADSADILSTGSITLGKEDFLTILGEVLSDMALAEESLEAALSVSSRVMSLSILDYL